MNDHEFLGSFIYCTLPPEHFDHRGHLRVAWLHLRRYPFAQAVHETCTGIARYAASLGAADKFHWTVTEALMHLMRAGGADEPASTFDGFLASNPELVANARAAVGRHYSAGLLATPEAKAGFVAPDLAPLPEP